MPDRDFDLVLYGATGFTGALVAAYLAHHAPDGLRWAIAGRNPTKLSAVADRLGLDVPRLTADSADEASLDALAARTRVVCTTVGPYLRYGFGLAKACAEAGTHYTDLTGEVPFMQQTIGALHDVAIGSGARIVHTCGYDSIPSDLATWLLQQAMADDGGPARTVRTYVGPSRGGVSGGTMASMMEVMKRGEDRAARKAMADPYALDPTEDRGGADTWDDLRPQHDDLIERWVAPFFMGPVNTRVVRRSHALLGRPWGPSFSYTEVMATGPGVRGAAAAYGITGALGLFVGAASQPALRELLERRILPAPGQGPDAATREAGFFRHLTVGVGSDPSRRRMVQVVGHQDPGYGATAIMLGQASLALAAQEADLPDAAGVLTPSVAMGGVLVDRLRNAGMTWDVLDWPAEGPPRP